MKLSIITCFLASVCCVKAFAQAESAKNYWVTENPYKKGNFFIYWGWNQSDYSKSDIHFSGENYDFTLFDVVAKDRQSRFDAKLYFNPGTMTIPQYNFRIGYFITDNYQLSIGADHMKYVMQTYLNNAYQTVKIDGYISETATRFDGTYENEDIPLTQDFLLFEHTDGLNYENIEFRRFDVFFGRKNFCVAVNEGIGLGMLLPRTNTTLLNNQRYDEFHVSGYGTSIVAALNLTFFKYFLFKANGKVALFICQTFEPRCIEPIKPVNIFGFRSIIYYLELTLGLQN